jgi:hypothetical protein
MAISLHQVEDLAGGAQLGDPLVRDGDPEVAPDPRGGLHQGE